MKSGELKPPAAAVWASLFFAILPLAYLAALYFAFRRQALNQEDVDQWTAYFRVLGAPGLVLCRLVGYEPSFWVEDALGSAFWEMLVVFLVMNFVGWLLLTTVFALGFRWVKRRVRGRRQSA